MRRVDPHCRRSAGRSRRGPDEREGAPGLPVETTSHERVGRRTAGHCAAGDGRNATYAARDRDEQLACVVESHLTDRALEEDVAPGNEGPRLTSVGRLEDADTRLRVT